MNKISSVQNEPCLNCGGTINGSFCNQCGQKALDNIDRSMATLLGGFFTNLFFLDNRFFLSIRMLVTRPGTMTVDFLNGQRKKFLPPVTLFLFANLIYFFLTPLTDYSLPLHDQVKWQPYSPTAKRLIANRLNERGISFADYARTYNKASDNISKTVMILNIPMIALFVYLFTFRKRKFYFDSLIYSFHFFTVFLLSICVGDILSQLINPLVARIDIDLEGFWFILFLLALPILYLIVSLRKLASMSWWLAILGGFGLFVGLFLVQFVYRAIMFFLTFFTT